MQLIMLYVGGMLGSIANTIDGVGGRFRGQRDRGDVPGWVMITVMTAALVLAILIPFREAIVVAVQDALDSVITEAG